MQIVSRAAGFNRLGGISLNSRDRGMLKNFRKPTWGAPPREESVGVSGREKWPKSGGRKAALAQKRRKVYVRTMAKRRKKDSARSGEQSIDRNAIDALKVVLRDGYVIGGPLLAMYVFDLNWLAENAGEEVQHVLDDLHAYAFGQKASWDPATEECIRQHRRYSLYNPAEMPFEAGRKLKEENLRAVFRNALVRGDDGKIALRDPASPSHANTEARLASEQAMFEELASQAEEAAQPTEDVETTRLENGKPTRKGKNSNGPKGRAR